VAVVSYWYIWKKTKPVPVPVVLEKKAWALKILVLVYSKEHDACFLILLNAGATYLPS